jgi:hypothetical protein
MKKPGPGVRSTHAAFLWLLVSLLACSGPAPVSIRQWDKLTLHFDGPQTSESDSINPFLDYRLNVSFSLNGREFVVPGYYAADGHAAETGADGGKVWKVHFRPDEPGKWHYSVSFRTGAGIAVSDDPAVGKPVYFDGASGTLLVLPGQWPEGDTRGSGKLAYVGDRYLRFQGSGAWFLKAGADSPENLLAYADFDGTYRYDEGSERSGEARVEETVHRYEPHIRDWRTGDPTWMDGKGKGLIGALNYLAGKGMNSVYFLTMNIGGDGKDVWPYTHHEERFRFDCSKLDQWEIVFDHMDRLGLMLHVVTQETENEKLLDNGDTGLQRMLYYRELIARFAHHLAVTWNMGEENGPAPFTPDGQTSVQQKAMIRYMKDHDPYRNFVALHTHADPVHRYGIFEPLLGFKELDGPSIQIFNKLNAHRETKVWIEKSGDAGKQWVVCIDEIGPASRGVDPDDRPGNNQDTVRAEVLWGNLMAGGGGVEWYFGYKNQNNDLSCEDWRSRDRMWDYTRFAIDFFEAYLPYWDMQPADEHTDAGNYCLARPDDVYALFLPHGGSPTLDLAASEGAYDVEWYNPRTGGSLIRSSVTAVEAGTVVSLGAPPSEPLRDWAVLIRRRQ